MINAGKYSKQIVIYQIIDDKDSAGFPIQVEQEILTTYASVKTTKGFTLIANNSDFEKALTNFTIRYSQKVEDAYYNSDNSNRDMFVRFRNKNYIVQYLSNVNEGRVEIEMQCKEILK